MEEAEKHLPEADVLFTYGSDIQARHIEQAINLKWIMVMSAGVDQLPAEQITNREIIVTNSRGIHAIPMAEYTMLMMLYVYRQMPKMLANQKERNWKRLKNEEIFGKTIAILGTGAIGQEIARLAKAFQMKTLGYNRSGQQVDYVDEMYSGDQLDVALRQADFVVAVLPGTKNTEHLIGATQFEAMKASAVFINIGRGSTVHEEDLIDALKEGKIFHAVLDVFQKEPLGEESPFWQLDNVTITPHISGVTPAYQDHVFEIFQHNLHVFQSGEGEFLNLVNLNKGY